MIDEIDGSSAFDIDAAEVLSMTQDALDGAMAEAKARRAKLRLMTLTVSLGEETHSPIQYQSFRCGAVSATFAVQAGASLTAAYAEALAQLRKLAEAQFDEQLEVFFKHVRQAAAASRGGR